MLRAQAEAEKPETSSWHLSESESSTHDSVDTAFVILQCLQPHKSWPEISVSPKAVRGPAGAGGQLEKVFKAAVGFLEEGSLDARTYGKRIIWQVGLPPSPRPSCSTQLHCMLFGLHLDAFRVPART